LAHLIGGCWDNATLTGCWCCRRRPFWRTKHNNNNPRRWEVGKEESIQMIPLDDLEPPPSLNLTPQLDNDTIVDASDILDTL